MRSIRAIVVSLVLCLSGCLTSPNPFFRSEDIIEDANFPGTFYDRQEEITWTVSASGDEKGRYDIQLQDHAAISHFRGTLFKISDGTFLDLVSIGEIAVHLDNVPIFQEITGRVAAICSRCIRNV